MERQSWEIPQWGPHDGKIRSQGNGSLISGCVALSGPQTPLAHILGRSATTHQDAVKLITAIF